MSQNKEMNDKRENINNNDDELKYEVPPLNVDTNTTPNQSRKRRFSVSAEANKNANEQFIKKVYPKSQEILERILHSIQDLFIFKGLDKEEKQLLVDAMFEKKVHKNEDIITQGDNGDYFYVIEDGDYEVWKSVNLKMHIPPKKVFEYKGKGSFGELALMYNAPRAATVRAITDGTLWAVDRATFRHIIIDSTARKRNQYDDFLKDVPLFRNCSDELRSQIADTLGELKYKQNDCIIREKSTNCDYFYIIQHGKVAITLKQKNGKEKLIRELREFDYFGERALLLNDTRSASVIVTSKTLTCVVMDKASFIRLFDAVYDKFRMGMRNYVLSTPNKDSNSDLDDDDDDDDDNDNDNNNNDNNDNKDDNGNNHYNNNTNNNTSDNKNDYYDEY